MSYDADVLIAGAGLAGATAAFTLSADCDVHVIEADQPATGASGAAAGLVNPFMGRRARPVWRLRDALDAVSSLLAQADADELFPPQGVLRPVVEDDQFDPFRHVAEEYPDLASWWSPEEVRDRHPDVTADQGALFVPAGGAIDVPALVHALLNAARSNGATIETEIPAIYWRETPDAAVVEVGRGSDETEELRADRVILALGQGYPRFPELQRLGLTGIKGQTVRVRRPDTLTGPLCPLSGRGYVVPDADNTLVLGSNYDNNFDHLTPDPDETAYIREKTARMVPGIDQTEILEVRAGVRVKHKGSNLPLLGPLPDRDRLWAFTALGSKGLLTAPLLARSLPEHLHNPTTIPEAVRIST
jgi:glycine oxidase